VIVVDTNVASELMRPSPSPVVTDWVSAQSAGELRTTAITVAEIRYGLERMAEGRRKDRLRAAADEVFTAFSEYVMPFAAGAAVNTDVTAPPSSDLRCAIAAATSAAMFSCVVFST